MEQSSTLEEIRQFEASAANLYWYAWETGGGQVRQGRCRPGPGELASFEGRRSAVNPGTARNATDPINALLNLSYRLVEAEGHLATLAVGLDPGMGILHADLKGRASFVLDLIEAARPLADRHVLRLVRTQPLRWRDFHEDARGWSGSFPPHPSAWPRPCPGSPRPSPGHRTRGPLLAVASPYDVGTPSTLTREKHKAAARRRVDRTRRAVPQPVGPAHHGLSPRKKNRQKPRPRGTRPAPPHLQGVWGRLAPEPDRPRRRGAYCPECLSDRRKEVEGSCTRVHPRPGRI